MKQLLFLLLFPCLAMAQYPGNAGQKITLGEQTTADGLVYRGVASADTIRKPSIDTMAFILLDTTTNILWQYKKATNNAWTRLNLLPSDLGTGVATFLATPTSANLAAAVTNETGSGALVFATSPTLITPALGTPTSGVLTSATGLPIATGLTGLGAANRIPFASSTTALTTDNALRYDNSVKTLFIENSTAAATLNILGVSESGSYIRMDRSRGTTVLSQIGAKINYGGGDEDGLSGFFSGGSEKMTLLANGNVGIGTTNPSEKLDIRGNGATFTMTTSGDPINYSFDIENNYNENNSLKMYYSNKEMNFLSFSRSTSNLALQPTSGNVGIGTASPAVQLHTTGAVRFAGLASITDLRTDADGDLFNGSDFNLKNSIDTINFGLLDVMKLKPVSFNWNNEARNINEYKSMGFIAQDVMNVIPNAASIMGDGDMQIDYNAIVATLTKAIQEQQALIKALEQRILTLENK